MQKVTVEHVHVHTGGQAIGMTIADAAEAVTPFFQALARRAFATDWTFGPLGA